MKIVHKCSFCGSSEDDRKLLLEGPNGLYICDRCTTICNTVVKNVSLIDNKDQNKDVLKPKDIVDALDDYVIGQDRAKRSLAVTVYNHYKKLELRNKDIQLSKSNLLLIGPTGVGKTYLLQQIAKLLDVPFISVDTTQLTPIGYKGQNLNEIWERLFHRVNNSVEDMQKAIIYFDEIDKLTRDDSGSGRNFYAQIQNELLKVIEDSELTFSVDNMQGMGTQITIDTSNMLFIFGGAFSDIVNIIEKRLGLSTKSTIGFGNESNKIDKDKKNELISKVNLDDIREFGLTPEFIGRISSVVTLDPLSVNDLINILTKPKNNIVSQFTQLFAVDGVNLIFDDEALKYIAEKAYEKKTGARGLKSIIESSLVDAMYDIPSRKDIESCIVTKEVISDNKPVTLVKKTKRKNTKIKKLVVN